MWGVLVCLFFTSCSQTAEVKAWNAHIAELQARLATLNDTKSHFVDRRAEHDATVAEWTALDRRLDLPAQVRARALADLKLFQSGDAHRLSVNASVEVCRDVLRALAPMRHLTGTWTLRLHEGQCTWEASSAPELVTFRERESRVTAWVAPAHSLLSRDVEGLKRQTAALEQLIAQAELDLGSLAHVDALPGRIARGLSTEQELASKPAPCDLAVLERAATLDAQTLLEVQSARVIHPLDPLADQRLKGLATVREGQVTWTCAFDAGN